MAVEAVSRRDVVRGIAAGVPAALLAACRRSDAGLALRDRDVTFVADAQPTVEGAGVRLRRALGARALPMLDPFLLLDEIHSDRPDDYLAGFPTHPHRGFETVTYVLDGAMEHRDSLGNHGRLGPGSTQWMTAGHGIVHSEMPQQEKGVMWGFQLWVNLPAAMKMARPRYQDLSASRIPEFNIDDASVRLIAGQAGGHVGPVSGIVTGPQMLDVTIRPRGSIRHALPPSHNAFVYVMEGAVEVGPSRTNVKIGQLAVLGSGDMVRLSAHADAGARLLCVAGQPIGEPVARYGPFVMNTDAEIQQAVDDYRSGRLVGG